MTKTRAPIFILTALLLAACGTREAQPPAVSPAPAFEEVTFTTQDERQLAGRIYGDGEVAVILAHMLSRGHSQLNWAFFAEELAGRGYTVLTFDFRGMGKSSGNIQQEVHLTRIDARTAIQYLQGRGFEKIVCIGASMGGTACLSAALDTDLSGVVSLSAPDSMGAPTELTRADLAGLAIPKLFIFAEDDQPYAGENRQMYQDAAEPKEIHVFSGGSHGTNLFNTGYRDQLMQLIFDFLEGF